MMTETLTRDATEVLKLIEAVQTFPSILDDVQATLDMWTWPHPTGNFLVSTRNFLWRRDRELKQRMRDRVEGAHG